MLSNPTPDQIRQARLDAGLTPQQAAGAIGYSHRAWREFESGKRVMRITTFAFFLQRTKKRPEAAPVANLATLD